MFRFEITANAAANNADSTNSAKALDVIDKLLEKESTAGHWYAEWNSFSADDNKEVRQRIRFHYESLGFNVTETCQGFRIGFLDAKEETHARDYYNRVAAIMDERINALGSQIQESIKRNSESGSHSVLFKVTEKPEIVSIIKSKLEDAGFKVTLKDDVITVIW